MKIITHSSSSTIIKKLSASKYANTLYCMKKKLYSNWYKALGYTYTYINTTITGGGEGESERDKEQNRKINRNVKMQTNHERKWNTIRINIMLYECKRCTVLHDDEYMWAWARAHGTCMCMSFIVYIIILVAFVKSGQINAGLIVFFLLFSVFNWSCWFYSSLAHKHIHTQKEREERDRHDH